LHAHFDSESLQRFVHQSTKFISIRDSKLVHRKQRLRRCRSSLRSTLASGRFAGTRPGRRLRLRHFRIRHRKAFRRLGEVSVILTRATCRFP
jgi:hypothetical protein